MAQTVHVLTLQGELSADGLANQAVAAYMYKRLEESQRDKLRICWYVATGESSPRTNHTCHIKIMSEFKCAVLR